MLTIKQTKPSYRRELIADGPTGKVFRITLRPGQATPPHNHSLPVIGLVKKGHPFELSDHDGYRDLHPGDSFGQSPAAIHMVGNPSTAKEDAIIEDFYPTGKLVMKVFPGFFDQPTAES